MPNKAHEVFPTLLKYHSRGFALYHPIPADDIQVGSLGMFDENGRWHRIYSDIRYSDLTDPYNGPLNPIDRDDGKSAVFSSISARSLETSLSGSVDGTFVAIPIEIGAELDLAFEHKEAAILRCGPLTWQGDRLHETQIREWGRDNIEEIMTQNPAVKKNAFFIVTGLTRTPWCQLKCWLTSAIRGGGSLTNEAPSAPVSGQLNAEDASDLSWAGSVIYKPGKNKIGNDSEIVVFIEGILCIPRLFKFHSTTTKKLFKGHDEGQVMSREVVFLDDNQKYEIEIEDWSGHHE